MSDWAQPWADVSPIETDDQKRRLGLNIPQLLSPLAKSPFSGASPTPTGGGGTPIRSSGSAEHEPIAGATPLSTATPDTKLAVQPAPPKPLAQQYGDVETQIQSLKRPKPDDPTYKVPTWKKILGVPLAIAAGINDPRQASEAYSGILRGPYNRAEAEYERNKGTLVERAKGIETESQIGEREATIAEKGRLPATKEAEEDWSVVPGAAGPNGELIQQEKRSGQIRYAPIKGTRPEKPDTQTQNKEAFQAIIGKVDAAKLPTDPKSLPKSLDAARQRGAITPEEHQKASGYLAANPTPSTTVQVQTTGKEVGQDIKNANTYYRWTDPKTNKIVTGKGGKVPQGVDADPIGDDKEYALHLREANTANIVQQSLNRIAQDVDETPELFDNATARGILATTLEQIDRQHAAMLVNGTGGSIPIPSGLGDMINTALQNKALNPKMAAAVKQYVADYKAMKDKGIVQQMEMQGGRIGRGSQEAFKAIVDQIPNGATADSATARRQVANLQATQDKLMAQYPDKNKETPYKLKTAAPAAGGSDMEYGTWKGQRVQRPKGSNAPWQLAPTQ